MAQTKSHHVPTPGTPLRRVGRLGHVWSAIMILLAVLVIFALTARWDEAQAAM
jgi:hypothetical protein